MARPYVRVKKLLTSHRFMNGARLAVYLMPNDPDRDYLLLSLTSRRREGLSTKGWQMRPDEAVLLIEKLAGALYKSVVGYTVHMPRKTR